MNTMLIYFYLFIVSIKFVSTEASSIRSWNYKNDVVPYMSPRGDVAKRDSSSFKVVSNEPFIIQLQTPPGNDSQKKDNGKKKQKKRRPIKKSLAKSKSSRQKHRNRRETKSTDVKPASVIFKQKNIHPESANLAKLPKLTNSTASKPVIRPQELIKLLTHLQEKKTEKISKSQKENKNQILQRHQQTTPKMEYPTTQKPDPTHKYTYKDVMMDRERLENKIKYLKNLLNVNDTNTSDDMVRVRRKTESDKNANKIAKMFLTLSAMNGLNEKRKLKCKNGEEEEEEGEEKEEEQVEGVWDTERKDPNVRKKYSYNEERYKVKKWIEHMKNKRSNSRTCPCMSNYAYTDYNDDSDVFPLEQKLAKDYPMSYIDRSSEESLENIRGRPQLWGRPQKNNGYTSRNSRPNDGPTKFLFQQRGRRKLELPMEDLELYRSRAKQILKNAEEILDKIKEEEEKRLASPNILLAQLKEMTSKIPSDPRATENELMRIIQKNLGLNLQNKAADGDKGTFLDNLKAFILDPYEKAKSLTDESAKELSSYLLRNLGKLEMGSKDPEKPLGGNKGDMQMFHELDPQKKNESSGLINLEKDNIKEQSILKQAYSHLADLNKLKADEDGIVNKEDPIKKRIEEMLKEQEEKVKNYTEPPEGDENAGQDNDEKKNTGGDENVGQINDEKKKIPTVKMSEDKLAMEHHIKSDSEEEEEKAQDATKENLSGERKENSGRDENDVIASQHLQSTNRAESYQKAKSQEELETTYDTFGYPFSEKESQKEKEIPGVDEVIVAQKHPLGEANESKEASDITRTPGSGDIISSPEYEAKFSKSMEERNENDVIASKHLTNEEQDMKELAEDLLKAIEKSPEKFTESDITEDSIDKMKSLVGQSVDSLLKEQDPNQEEIMQAVKKSDDHSREEQIVDGQLADPSETDKKVSSEDPQAVSDTENVKLTAHSKEMSGEDEKSDIVRAENQNNKEDGETFEATSNPFEGETLKAEKTAGMSRADVGYATEKDEALKAMNAMGSRGEATRNENTEFEENEALLKPAEVMGGKEESTIEVEPDDDTQDEKVRQTFDFKVEDTGENADVGVKSQEDVAAINEGDDEQSVRQDIVGGSNEEVETEMVKGNNEDISERVKYTKDEAERENGEEVVEKVKDLEDDVGGVERQEGSTERVGSSKDDVEKAKGKKDGVEEVRSQKDRIQKSSVEMAGESEKDDVGSSKDEQNGAEQLETQEDVDNKDIVEVIKNEDVMGLRNQDYDYNDDKNLVSSKNTDMVESSEKDNVGVPKSKQNDAEKLETQEDVLSDDNEDNVEAVRSEDVMGLTHHDDDYNDDKNLVSSKNIERVEDSAEGGGGSQDDVGKAKGVEDDVEEVKTQKDTVEMAGENDKNNVGSSKSEPHDTEKLETQAEIDNKNILEAIRSEDITDLRNQDDDYNDDQKLMSSKNIQMVEGDEKDEVGSSKSEPNAEKLETQEDVTGLRDQDYDYNDDQKLMSGKNIEMVEGNEKDEVGSSKSESNDAQKVEIQEGVMNVHNEDNLEATRSEEIVSWKNQDDGDSSKENDAGKAQKNDMRTSNERNDDSQEIKSQENVGVRNQDADRVESSKESSIAKFSGQEGGFEEVRSHKDVSDLDYEDRVNNEDVGGVRNQQDEDDDKLRDEENVQSISNEKNDEELQNQNEDIHDPFLQAVEKEKNQDPSRKTEFTDSTLLKSTETSEPHADEEILEAINKELEALETDGDDTLQSTHLHLEEGDETLRSANPDKVDEKESEEVDPLKLVHEKTDQDLKSTHSDKNFDVESPVNSFNAQEDLQYNSQENDLEGNKKPFATSGEILGEGLQRLDPKPIQGGQRKLKIPLSIRRIMSDLDGENEKDLSIQNLDPEKIDHYIGKIGEAEQQNLEDDDLDCRKECACAEQITTRSRNVGRYEIVKDFLHWMKDLQLNRVLNDN